MDNAHEEAREKKSSKEDSNIFEDVKAIIKNAKYEINTELDKQINVDYGGDFEKVRSVIFQLYYRVLSIFSNKKNDIIQKWKDINVKQEKVLQHLGYQEKVDDAQEKLREVIKKEEKIKNIEEELGMISVDTNSSRKRHLDMLKDHRDKLIKDREKYIKKEAENESNTN